MKTIASILCALAASAAAWAGSSPEEAAKLYAQALKGGNIDLLVQSLGPAKKSMSAVEKAQWVMYLQEAREQLQSYEVERVTRGPGGDAGEVSVLVQLKSKGRMHKSFAVSTSRAADGQWFASIGHR